MVMTRSMRRIVLVLTLAVTASWSAQTRAAPSKPAPVMCTGGPVKTQDLVTPTAAIAGQPDLIVSGVCQVVASSKQYYYGAVNIVAKGTLQFVEPTKGAADQTTQFWASSIIVESGGAMRAGTPTARYGANGAVL